MKYLNLSIKYLLWATALMPLVVMRVFSFPFNFGRVFFFRVMVEIAAILFLIHLAAGWRNGMNFFFISRIKKLFRNPLFLAMVLFFFSIALSAIFAENPFHAFFGNIERGEGFLGILHYFIFLLLTALVFEKKDWMTFFRISVVVGFLPILYAWFQYWGVVKSFSFTLTPITVLSDSTRPGSFFDNPAFLASYLVLLPALVGAAFAGSRRGSLWRWVSGVLLVVSIPTIFLADVRGPILGLFVGALFFLVVYAFLGDAPRMRRASGFILCAVILLGGVFWFTREASFWKKVPVPGLRRLTELNLRDSSVQTRLIALQVSFEAFKERPLLGWGPENYNVAYNKYYNPDYATYEEAWFDRAHNKIAELAVIQGSLGVLAYLSMLAGIFYLVFTKRKNFDFSSRVNGENKESRNEGSGGLLAAFLSSALTAYLFQNLFLFDTPVSYLLFFVIVGFLLTLSFGENGHEKGKEQPKGGEIRSLGAYAAKAGAAVGAIVLLYGLYSYNYIPFRQSKAYRRAADTEVGKNIVDASNKFLNPYNFLQPTLRFRFLQLVAESNVWKRPEFKPLVEGAIGAMEEVIAKEPEYEPRNFILLAEAYNELAKSDDEKRMEFFRQSEDYLQKALELSPKRQDIYYLLAFSLAGQGRFDESIETVRKAVALSPDVAKARYNLGLELALAGREYWPEAEKELALARELSTRYRSFFPTDVANIAVVYEKMLATYILERDKAGVLRVAESFRKLSPEYEEDMNTIIGLAERGEWDLLIGSVER